MEIPARVVYLVSQQREVGREEGSEEDTEVKPKDNASNVRGHIYAAGANSATFRSEPTRGSLLVEGFSFDTIAGYRREDHRPDFVALVDLVKEKIYGYFN